MATSLRLLVCFALFGACIGLAKVCRSTPLHQLPRVAVHAMIGAALQMTGTESTNPVEGAKPPNFDVVAKPAPAVKALGRFGTELKAMAGVGTELAGGKCPFRSSALTAPPKLSGMRRCMGRGEVCMLLHATICGMCVACMLDACCLSVTAALPHL